MQVMMLSSKSLLLFSVVFYIWLCPYTKVEESFNIQATHDLLFLQNVADSGQTTSTVISIHDVQTYLTDFDHLEFPGVVPRTFLGSIFLAIVSMPVKAVLEISNFPKILSQYAVRLSLGVCSWMSFTLFSDAVSRRFGPRAGRLTCILASLQFHIPFYMSRTLPNTFALIGCLVAYSVWLNGRGLRALLVITVAMMIFRCDLLMLLAPLTLQLLLSREVPFWLTALLGIGTGALAVSLSVAVDSVFWQRLVWPEGVVLFFNTVQNKSGEWGVMSAHWYISNALPKSIHMCIPLALFALLGLRYPFGSADTLTHTKTQTYSDVSDFTILRHLSTDAAYSTDMDVSSKSEESQVCTVDSSGARHCSGPSSASLWAVCRLMLLGVIGLPDTHLLYYCAPAISYIALYSILPHKELRFIFPVIPLLIMAGAVGLDRLLPTPVSAPASVCKGGVVSPVASQPSIQLSTAPAVAGGLVLSTGTVHSAATNTSNNNNNNNNNRGNNNNNNNSSSSSSSSNGSSNESARHSSSSSGSVNSHTVKRAVDCFLWTMFYAMLLISALLTSLFAHASHLNYPGGVALRSLLSDHIAEDVLHVYTGSSSARQSDGSRDSGGDGGASRNEGAGAGAGSEYSTSTFREGQGRRTCRVSTSVHIDVAAAMTGVTRFGQEPFVRLRRADKCADMTSSSSSPCSAVSCTGMQVTYSKVEELSAFDSFDWLLTADPRSHGKSKHFDIVAEVPGFVSYFLWPGPDPPPPSSSSAMSHTCSIGTESEGVCLVGELQEGGRKGEGEDKAVGGGSGSESPKRTKTRVTVLGMPTPLGVVTETAVYIMRNKNNSSARS